MTEWLARMHCEQTLHFFAGIQRVIQKCFDASIRNTLMLFYCICLLQIYFFYICDATCCFFFLLLTVKTRVIAFLICVLKSDACNVKRPLAKYIVMSLMLLCNEATGSGEDHSIGQSGKYCWRDN